MKMSGRGEGELSRGGYRRGGGRGRGGFGGGKNNGHYSGGGGTGFSRGGGGFRRDKWGNRDGNWHHKNMGASTTSVAVPGTSQPAEVILEHWSNASAALLPPEEQLKFEKPKTNLPEEAMRLTIAMYEERQLVMDENGKPIFDCRGNHGLEKVCMFCDGRRGQWVRETVKEDPVFKRYQDSFIEAAPLHLGSKSGIPFEQRKKLVMGSVVQQVPLRIDIDDNCAEDYEEFGMLDSNNENILN